MKKKLKIPKVRNIRELSQYKAADGKSIKPFSIIRSGRLDKAKEKNRNRFIKEYNIGTIIDLRTDIEVLEGKPIKYPDNVKYVHIPLLDKAFFGITHEKKMRKALYNESIKIKDKAYYKNFMVNMYKGIVFDEQSQAYLKSFFDILLEKNEGGVLYHCTGGKDRTGVTSLLLLTILGVSKEDIIKDFCQSDISNRRHNIILSILLNIFLFPFRRFKKLLYAMLFAKREYLEKTIEAIEESYGSIMNYLEEVIDINDDKINKLKELFLN